LDLDKKDANIKKIAEKALKDEGVLAELLASLKDKDDTIRSNSFEALKYLAEERPEHLYPRWGYVEQLLRDANNYRKFIAVHILARLVKRDNEGRFEKIFDTYYDLLGASVIVAGHVTELSARIVKAKPELEPMITARLLAIDSTTQKHKDLIKAGAIDSFSEYFELIADKGKVIGFVRGLLDCESLKTRKKAKEFLKRFDKE
jgi:hypothetical protein